MSASILSEEKIQRFREAVTFSGDSNITSIDFSIDGKYLVAANDNEQVIWFDCLRGKENQVINSHKYGVKLVKYTNGKTAVLHSSSKLNHDIRLLDVQKQNYYRYFKGHKSMVTSLAIHSEDDIFASGGEDRTVFIYDFRKEMPVGKLTLNMDKPSVVFDPAVGSNTFAVGFENNCNILLYDLRSYKSNQILKKIALEKDRTHCPHELKFSKDGLKILATTNGSFIHLHEVSSGLPLAQLTGFKSDSRYPIEASFTPDSNYVLSGSMDGDIHFWDISGYGTKIARLPSGHKEPIRHLKFNPKFLMFASSCKNTTFWLPHNQNES